MTDAPIMTAMAEAAQSLTLSDGAWAVFAVPIGAALIGLAGVVWKAISDRRAAAAVARRTANEELFTAALDAVHEYQELPYRIRRRSDVSPTTPAELAAHASDVQVLLDKHITRLTFLDPNVGDAFRELVGAVRQEAGSHLNRAWTQARIATDEDMNLGNAYPRTQTEEALKDCIRVMQSFLMTPATG